MKITVVTINYKDNKTVYLQNRGYTYEELSSMLDKYGIRSKTISSMDVNEIKCMLDYITDASVKIYYVGQIANHYNQNQSEINKIKSNAEQWLSGKGYDIIPVSEANDILSKHINDKAAQDIGNSLNWLDTLQARCKEQERRETELEDIEKQVCDKRRLCVEAQNKYDKLNQDFNELAQRYKNGQRCIIEQQQQFEKNKQDIDSLRASLPNDIIAMQDKLNDIETSFSNKTKENMQLQSTIEAKYNEIDKLDNNIKNGEDKLSVIKLQENEKQANINKMTNDIRLLQYETDKAQRELQTVKQELEFSKNVLLKGINVHTNDVIVDLIHNKQKYYSYDELDKIIIGTVLTHDTISLLYDAVCK